MKQPALPPHLQPAREFYDALAEMIAEEILRNLRTQAEKPEQQAGNTNTKVETGYASG
jgi:hypothetical protein